MHDDWRAALEYLKRRHADRWQDRSKMKLTGRIDVAKLTGEELTFLHNILEKAAPKP